MLLNEKIFAKMLLEAKSKEQVLNIFLKRYSDKVTNETLNALLELDPTKKFSYSQWVLNAVKNDSELSRVISDGDLQNLFNFARENNDFQLQTYKTLNNAFDGMVEFKGKTEYSIIYEDDEWVIYQPHTYEADRYLAWVVYGGARWCTASGRDGDFDGKKMFNQYTSGSDRLFIFANKATNEIYQYADSNNELKDSENESITPYGCGFNDGVMKCMSELGCTEFEYAGFPEADDIYYDGYWGLKCVNDLYGEYNLCNDQGRILSTRDFSHCDIVWESKDLVVVQERVNRRKESWYGNRYEEVTCYSIFVRSNDGSSAWEDESFEFGEREDTFNEGDNYIIGKDSRDNFSYYQFSSMENRVIVEDCESYGEICIGDDEFYEVVTEYDEIYIVNKKSLKVVLDAIDRDGYDYDDKFIYFNKDGDEYRYDVGTGEVVVLEPSMTESIKRDFWKKTNKLNEIFNRNNNLM